MNTLAPPWRFMPRWNMTWAPRPLAFGAIDDHPVILTGLAEGLRPRLPAGSRLWPVARTVSELLAWPGDLDVVLMDLELHDDTDPADNVVKLRARGWPVIIFTQDPRHAKVARAFRSGASGLLSKSEDLDVIAQALLVVASGEGYLSKEWASAIAADLELVAPALSEREFAAVQLYAGGLKLTSVARRLGVGPETARTYLNRAREKYASVGRPAPTKTDLYRVAVEDGLLDPPSSPPNRR
jgi:DNA-binding NarL/FixJ family response regulator